MKIKKSIYIIKNVRVKIIILIMILFTLILFFSIYKNKESEFVVEVSTINTKNIDKIQSVETVALGEENINNLKETIHLKQYENMPEKLAGYKVIGKIEIEKIGLEKYILEETNEKTLKKSVTKICGPEINKEGNFCIAGHNYQSIFGKLSRLEIEDIIKLTDTYDRTVEYKIYDIQKVKPNDTECLSQETKGEREVTLVTCTLGAVNRIIVKGIEVYD